MSKMYFKTGKPMPQAGVANSKGKMTKKLRMILKAGKRVMMNKVPTNPYKYGSICYCR